MTEIDLTSVASELGMAQFLANNSAGVWSPQEFFYHEKKKLWFKWMKSHFEECTSQSFISLVLAPAIQAIQPSPSFEKLKFLTSVEKLLAPMLAGLPHYGVYLSFKNCHLRLSDFKQVGHSPVIRNVLFLDFDYDPNTKAPEFLAWLRMQFPDDAEFAYVITMLGTLLVTNTLIKSVLAFVDDANGDSGKSSFLVDALAGALGPYALEGAKEWLYGGGTAHDTSEWEHKLLIYFDEADSAIDEERFKQFGSKSLRIRPLYNKGYTIPFSGRAILTKNGYLNFKGQRSNAMYKRLKVMMCRHSIKKDVQRIHNVYENEYAGIINCLIAGAKIYKKQNGKPKVPDFFKVEHKAAVIESDSYTDYIDSCLVAAGPEEFITAKQNRFIYSRWTKTVQERPLTDNDVLKMSRLISSELLRIDGVRKSNTGGMRYYGLQWKEKWKKFASQQD